MVCFIMQMNILVVKNATLIKNILKVLLFLSHQMFIGFIGNILTFRNHFYRDVQAWSWHFQVKSTYLTKKNTFFVGVQFLKSFCPCNPKIQNL